MIEITIEEFVLWVVGTAMVLVAVYVILTGAKHHREAKARVKKVIRCHGCGYVYHDDKGIYFQSAQSVAGGITVENRKGLVD